MSLKLNKKEVKLFKESIWNFYNLYGRNFPWRNINNAYQIVVSEIMLQQTQTFRVIKKFEEFIISFSDFNQLAQASLREVLSVWQGLGYNRRGKFLQQIAQKIVSEFNGELPNKPEILETFPGIGPATAPSICAFAFNKPTVFIETNIRAVFIFSFFQHKQAISDKEIFPLIEQTVDYENPREWYYALMDYGVTLKRFHANPSRKSSHYASQSCFEGSDRQIRGKIIKLLTEYQKINQNNLIRLLQKDEERVKKIIDQLLNEGLICQQKELFYI